MKLLTVFVALLVSVNMVNGQVPRKIRDVKPLTQNKTVIVYEDVNFGGTGKIFEPGVYPLTGFNDVASSVKVPAGMGVMLYENGNEKEGYGAYVDLLEDCVDLSLYNLNDKVSYISVFNLETRLGHVWIRNRMVNNKFIPGHWERKRSDGRLPDNSPPAVVSTREQPISTSPTVLSVNGPNTIINNIGVQTTAEKMYWEKAMNQQLGVIGNDFRGIETIGTACFQRASNNPAIPDNINFWYPQKRPNDDRYFKRTLVGLIQNAKQYYKSGTFEDFDMNIDIYPDPPYMYLLNEAHKPKFTGIMQTQYYASLTKSGESGCPASFSNIELEIADKYRPAENYTSPLIFSCRSRYGQRIAVYGPWIWDEGHCRHPEIHPAEQVWWSEPSGNYRKFNLNVFCDASGRFLWRSQMDDGTKLKPWAEPPIKGLFAIAFEYTLPAITGAVGYPTIKFEVSNIQHNNVIEYPNADQTYNLMYEGKNIISFVPHNNAFKVSFENVGISPQDKNKIRGFLVIETSVGVLTQIATQTTIPGSNIIFKLPQGSSPSQAPQILERTFFKKESGYYSFILTETNVMQGRPSTFEQ